ncbi:MAG: hypothetical protein SFU86_12470, partial [Pirellulaceae bacterium]|nr:hypothetical protein [Pirellulaceae bacterium]
AVLTHGPKEVVLAHPLARELYFGTSAEMGESSARPAAKKPAPMTDLSSPAAEPPRPAPRPTKPTSRRSIHEEETLGTEP